MDVLKPQLLVEEKELKFLVEKETQPLVERDPKPWWTKIRAPGAGERTVPFSPWCKKCSPWWKRRKLHTWVIHRLSKCIFVGQNQGCVEFWETGMQAVCLIVLHKVLEIR